MQMANPEHYRFIPLVVPGSTKAFGVLRMKESEYRGAFFGDVNETALVILRSPDETRSGFKNRVCEKLLMPVDHPVWSTSKED